jgi:hypothetical protein
MKNADRASTKIPNCRNEVPGRANENVLLKITDNEKTIPKMEPTAALMNEIKAQTWSFLFNSTDDTAPIR